MRVKVTNDAAAVNFAPDFLQEIIQNVRTILTTAQGSAPLYREFGIDAGLVDAPISVAKAKLTAEIARQIAAFEPRCQLVSCTFDFNLDGKINITALIEAENGQN